MSYEEKYLKYKNKYLALKSKLSNLSGGAEEVVKVEDNKLAVSEDKTPEVVTETTVNNQEPVKSNEAALETDVEAKFQSGGAKKKSKSKSKNSSYKKHFFQDDSDITDKSSVSSVSDFSSSDLDW